MARDYDLILSLFPFEKKWFAGSVPGLPVEFVGHPFSTAILPPAGRKLPSAGILSRLLCSCCRAAAGEDCNGICR